MENRGIDENAENVFQNEIDDLLIYSGLLSFFDMLPNNTTISTDLGCNYDGKELSDELVIKYFFNNNKEALYAVGLAYNHDENTYTEYTYKKDVTCIFAKKITKNLFLLCYGWIGANPPKSNDNEYRYWLSLYDSEEDRLTDTRSFCWWTPHELFKKSIIFSDNQIFSVELVSENQELVSFLEYFVIDKEAGKFNILQKNKTNQILWMEDVSRQRSVYHEELINAGLTIEGRMQDK
jgi:hypothetical protein